MLALLLRAKARVKAQYGILERVGSAVVNVKHEYRHVRYLIWAGFCRSAAVVKNR